MTIYYKMLQKLGHAGLYLIGRSFGAGVLVILFAAWVLTEPFFHLAASVDGKQINPKDG